MEDLLTLCSRSALEKQVINVFDSKVGPVLRDGLSSTNSNQCSVSG